MRSVRAVESAVLTPEAALRLWTDVRRWPSFVEGFAHAEQVSDGWPRKGSKVVWRSGPGGRGRVTEKVVEHGSGRFVTAVFEDALSGTQSLLVGETADGSRVELELEYELAKGGPLRVVTDLIFIRRAQQAALERTLRRFRVEAQEEAGLR
jgi:hypothetical protein